MPVGIDAGGIARSRGNHGRYILSIDQGTTSTRAILFDHSASIVASRSASTSRSSRRPAGSSTTRRDPRQHARVIGRRSARPTATRHDVAAVGITNQRETAIVWDRTPASRSQRDRLAGHPHPAHRRPARGGRRRRPFPQQTGLPLATYFSATKIAWLLDNVEGARERAEAASCSSAPPTAGCSGT